MDLIVRYDITAPEFSEHLTEYIGENTPHFVHEFLNFARSPYDMIGYDHNVQYNPHEVDITEDVVNTVSDSSDSDIILLSPEPQR